MSADEAIVRSPLAAGISRASRGSGRACALVAAAATMIGAWAPSPAKADSVASAQRQAHEIAARIARLQPQVDQALAEYDTVLQSVSQGIAATVAAQRMARQLDTTATQARIEQAAHSVALYKSGGDVALYAAVLEKGDINDVRQVQMLAGMVARDTTTTQTATRLAAAAKAAAADAESRWTQQISDADTVTDQLTRLQDLLAQQQALLDQANAQVKQLQAVRDAAARVAAVRAAAMGAGVVAAQSAVPLPVPPAFAALYRSAAATCPGLSWKVLAAIGQVETRHGQGSMVSSAGALGPMQFMPATFARYATDGDGDGKADIMNPADSIFTAARYLCANGAGLGGQHLHDALWNYNHAEWYVDLVLSLAAKIS